MLAWLTHVVGEGQPELDVAAELREGAFLFQCFLERLHRSLILTALVRILPEYKMPAASYDLLRRTLFILQGTYMSACHHVSCVDMYENTEPRPRAIWSLLLRVAQLHAGRLYYVQKVTAVHISCMLPGTRCLADVDTCIV